MCDLVRMCCLTCTSLSTIVLFFCLTNMASAQAGKNVVSFHLLCFGVWIYAHISNMIWFVSFTNDCSQVS